MTWWPKLYLARVTESLLPVVEFFVLHSKGFSYVSLWLGPGDAEVTV